MEIAYFDTNALWSPKWPMLTGTQDKTFKLARRFGCRLGFADVVQTELRQLWLRQHRKAMTDYKSTLERLNQTFGTVRLGAVPLLEWDGGPDAYEQRVHSLVTEVQFHITATTAQPVAVLVERAAARRAPFQDADKGFRDTALLLSIVDEVGSDADVYLVSGDSAFDHAAVHAEVAASCRTFRLLKKVDELADVFLERLNSPELSAVSRDQERARTLIRDAAPSIVSERVRRMLVGTQRSSRRDSEGISLVVAVPTATVDRISDIDVSGDPSKNLTDIGLAVSFRCLLKAELVVERRMWDPRTSDVDLEAIERAPAPDTERLSIEAPLEVEGVFLPASPGDARPVNVAIDSVRSDYLAMEYLGFNLAHYFQLR